VDDSGRVEAEAVLGVVPAEYGVDGTSLSCSFHKEEAAGLLRVEIVKGGEVINEATTRLTLPQNRRFARMSPRVSGFER
jgi:hypothetical protein